MAILIGKKGQSDNSIKYLRHWLKERAEAVEEERRAKESLMLLKEEKERLQI